MRLRSIAILTLCTGSMMTHAGAATPRRHVDPPEETVDRSAIDALTKAIKDGKDDTVQSLLATGRWSDLSESEWRRPVIWATERRNATALQMLIEAGAPPQWTEACEPLSYAIMADGADMVRLLLDAGADPNAAGSWGRRPLHAINLGGETVTRLLIEAGADVNVSSQNGWTPLHSGAADEAVVNLLLDAGADPHAVNADGVTPIHLAMKFGNVAGVTRLMAAGADVRRVTNDGMTALHYAALSDSAEMVMFLVQQGFEVDASRPDGATPLVVAVEALKAESAAALIDAGADSRLTATDGWLRGKPLLILAIRAHALGPGSEDRRTLMIETLLKYGVDVMQIDADGHNSLHHAARLSRSNMSELFIDAGGDLNARTAGGETPLLIALGGSLRSDVAPALLEAGADVNARDARGASPLHRASERCIHIGALLARSADPNARDAQAETALHRAAGSYQSQRWRALREAFADRGDANSTDEHASAHLERQHIAIRAMLAAGADVNRQSFSGATAMMIAAKRSDPTTVSLLLRSGAAADIQDLDGRRAVDYARDREDTEGREIEAILDHS